MTWGVRLRGYADIAQRWVRVWLIWSAVMGWLPLASMRRKRASLRGGVGKQIVCVVATAGDDEVDVGPDVGVGGWLYIERLTIHVAEAASYHEGQCRADARCLLFGYDEHPDSFRSHRSAVCGLRWSRFSSVQSSSYVHCVYRLFCGCSSICLR